MNSTVVVLRVQFYLQSHTLEKFDCSTVYILYRQRQYRRQIEERRLGEFVNKVKRMNDFQFQVFTMEHQSDATRYRSAGERIAL